MRSTRSRSIDSESSRPGLKRGQKKAGQATRTGSTNDDLQHARQGKGRSQSRPLQDLATVVEDLSIPDQELPQDELDETDQIAERGKSLPKRFSGARSPGVNSTFSGNTARISGSAPSWADSDPVEEVSQGTSKKSAKSELAVNVSVAQIRPVFRALSGPLDTALQQPTSKPGGLGDSDTSFNSPRIIQVTAGYLKQTKANRKALGKFREAPQQSLDSVRNVPIPTTANPTVRASASKLAIPSSAPTKMQLELTAETAEKRCERSQPTDASFGFDLQPQTDWQHEGFEEDSIDSSTESREEVYVMARRVKERKLQLEADNNKENLAELPGPSRRPEYQLYRSRSAQGGKRKYFIDPQPNAERLRFDDSQDSPQHAQLRRKRQREEPEAVVGNGENRVDTIEVSEDEGFQQDRGAIGAASNTIRTRAPNRDVSEPVAHQILPKKTGSTPRHENLDDELRDAVTRHDQGQTPEPSQFENYKKANEMAKRSVAVQAKKVQIRKAWTDEETETLISLIGDHGISWKLLKEQDNANGSILENRDQVALKDKARNMKFDYLKAGPYLPSNFENVPLNKMQTDKLRNLGIVYDPTTGQRDNGDVETMDADEE